MLPALISIPPHHPALLPPPSFVTSFPSIARPLTASLISGVILKVMIRKANEVRLHDRYFER